MLISFATVEYLNTGTKFHTDNAEERKKCSFSREFHYYETGHVRAEDHFEKKSY